MVTTSKISLSALTLSLLFVGQGNTAERNSFPDGVWAIDLEATARSLKEADMTTMQSICRHLSEYLFPLMQIIEIKGSSAWYSVLAMPTSNRIRYQLIGNHENVFLYREITELGSPNHINIDNYISDTIRVRWGSPPKPMGATYVWKQHDSSWLAKEVSDLGGAADRRYAEFNRFCQTGTK